jgi:hypothetical protein
MFHIDDLKTAIESQHGGVATLAQSVPVRETFEGQPIWEGVVHVFDLEAIPRPQGPMQWSSPIEGSNNAGSLPCCMWAEYELRNAVRAAIVAEHRARDI